MNNITSRRAFLRISGAGLAATQLGAFQQAPSPGRLFAYLATSITPRYTRCSTKTEEQSRAT